MRRLDQAAVERICRSLASQIKKDGNPSVIVSIRTGGDEIGRLLSKMLGRTVVEIHIARPDRTEVYQQIARKSKLLAKVVYELLFLIDRPQMHACPEISRGADVLIVDDAIQSGKTLRLAKQWVEQSSPRQVRVAAVTDMRWWHRAEYVQYRSPVSFPWSKNRKG